MKVDKKCTGSQRSNQKRVEGDSLKIHCTMEKRLNAVRKQKGGTI